MATLSYHETIDVFDPLEKHHWAAGAQAQPIMPDAPSEDHRVVAHDSIPERRGKRQMLGLLGSVVWVWILDSISCWDIVGLVYLPWYTSP